MANFILCLTIAMLSVGSVLAALGPETATTPSAFPQLVHIDETAKSISHMGAILSSQYIVATKDFAATSTPDLTLRVYSGDFTSRLNAKVHKVEQIFNSNRELSVFKICPKITGYTPISMVESENFDYNTNKTGKLVYVNEETWNMFSRTTDVLTDQACGRDDGNGPGQERAGYVTQKMTCSKADLTVGSCGFMVDSPTRLLATFPILVVDANTVGIYDVVLCNLAAPPFTMKSTMLFFKTIRQKNFITGNAVVDRQ